jgi:hypothetical protein
MLKQRIYFEWMGMLWKLTPEKLLQWINDMQAKKEKDIGEYGPRHKAKKYPRGIYKSGHSADGCSGGNIERCVPAKDLCLLNMTDWETADLKIMKKQVEEYLAGKRPYLDSYQCG